jgi:hypothetical protein
VEEQRMIELIEGLPGNVVGIVVSGRISQQDCREVLAPAMQRSLRRHDKIRLYYELSCRFPGAAWEDLDLGIEHAAQCERVAIVTDVGWVGLTVRALRFLIPGEIRVFPTIQAPESLAWIKARPGSRADAPAPAPVRARSARSPAARRSSPGRALATAARHRQAGEPGPQYLKRNRPPVRAIAPPAG